MEEEEAGRGHRRAASPRKSEEPATVAEEGGAVRGRERERQVLRRTSADNRRADVKRHLLFRGQDLYKSKEVEAAVRAGERSGSQHKSA